MPPDLNEVKRWLEKADHDRAGAEALLQCKPPVTDVAAFHCQQAVEKLLKRYLLYREQTCERTHDLLELLALCETYEPRFQELRNSAGSLTPYAVRFRYPGPADPTVEEASAAFTMMEAVWRFVLALLPPETRP